MLTLSSGGQTILLPSRSFSALCYVTLCIHPGHKPFLNVSAATLGTVFFVDGFTKVFSHKRIYVLKSIRTLFSVHLALSVILDLQQMFHLCESDNADAPMPYCHAAVLVCMQA